MVMLSGLTESYVESFITYDDEVVTLYEDNKGNNTYRKLRCVNGQGNIFFIGDSFSDAMRSMISRIFEYSDFVHF